MIPSLMFIQYREERQKEKPMQILLYNWND